MQFGISTHLFHNDALGEQHLRQVAAHGFDAVELFAVTGHFDYRNPAAVRELGAWLSASGLRLHSVHSPIVDSLVNGRWGEAYNNATTNQAARQQAVREAILTAEIAAVVPYEYLVVHLGLPFSQKPARSDNDRDQARRSVEELHETASRNGVQLALEVIPNDLSSADSLVRMIEDEFEVDGLGICLDFGHAFMMGDLVDAIETVAGHMVTTHVHDNRGKTDDHLAPFEGRIDWTTALMSMQKIGYEGTLLFELQSLEPASTVLERAAAARRRFEQILEGDWGALPVDQ